MLAGDEELTVDEVERLSEDTQPLIAGTPKEGNRRQAEVFDRRYSGRQHEVPGDRDIKQGLAREPLE